MVLHFILPLHFAEGSSGTESTQAWHSQKAAIEPAEQRERHSGENKGRYDMIWPNSQTVEHIGRHRETLQTYGDLKFADWNLLLCKIVDQDPSKSYLPFCSEHPAHGKKEHPFGLKVFWERLGCCCKLQDASPVKFGKWTADQRNQTKHMYNVQIQWRIISFVLEHVGHELGKPETAENTSLLAHVLFRHFVLCRPQMGRSSSGFSRYQGSLGNSSCTSTNLFFASQPLIVKDHVSCRLRSTQQRNFLDWLYWICNSTQVRGSGHNTGKLRMHGCCLVCQDCHRVYEP